LQAGLGELEIKAETLRYVACAGSDLLADASFNIEQWLMRKADRGFRAVINNALIVGNGIGMPMGILNLNAGIPICDTSPSTPTGQFTWQDLLVLAYEIPIQWHAGSVFLMNQRTLALLMTMSDTSTRPAFGQLPEGRPGPQFAGFPIVVVSQMPDVGLGSTSVLFGNLRSTYTIVDRQATTVMHDPYSAGFCHLFKWEARVGGLLPVLMRRACSGSTEAPR
jgi:HK97 family phage major capsid protein